MTRKELLYFIHKNHTVDGVPFTSLADALNVLGHRTNLGLEFTAQSLERIWAVTPVDAWPDTVPPDELKAMNDTLRAMVFSSGARKELNSRGKRPTT